MVTQAFRPGDFVVYRQTKFSRKPGPRASAITPAENGDTYRYNVDKYWIVVGRTDDDELLVKTPTGKHRTIHLNDPNIRRAHWWEKLLNRERFASLMQQLDEAGNAQRAG